MTSEFDLIARFFRRPAPVGMLGVGDDCALFPVTAGYQVATSTDLLLEGRHFFPDVDPCALGHKSLAVNLSDLAAMGARPLACVLGLGLPHIDEQWVGAFAQGFHGLADQHGCALIGGDTTRSTQGVVISVTVFGEVAPQLALRRDAALPGDDVWVSGTLGEADLAYRLLGGLLPPDDGRLAATRAALEWPQPQVQLGLNLRGVARACLDVSDGLLQDLGHILTASHVGAELWWHSMPVSPALDGLPEAVRMQAALGGGDLYGLCFTAGPARRVAVQQAAESAGVAVTRVGTIRATQGIDVLDRDGLARSVPIAGFDHFSSP